MFGCCRREREQRSNRGKKRSSRDRNESWVRIESERDNSGQDGVNRVNRDWIAGSRNKDLDGRESGHDVVFACQIIAKAE